MVFGIRNSFLMFWGILIFCGSRALAQQSPDPREVLEQLNSVSVDPSQIYVLRDTQITRDRVKIYFNRGFVSFFTKVAGEITGAVFSGDGEVLLIPSDRVEKQSLAQFTQSPILEERFASAYLRFTDQTARELLAQGRRPDPDDPEQPTGFMDRWDPVVRRLNPDYSIRILQDLLGSREFPYFDARIQGVNLGIFEVTEDERMPEAVRVDAVHRSRGSLYADVWCSFASRTSEARAPSPAADSIQVRSYKIDTRIDADNSLKGRAELELDFRSSTDRVIRFELSRLLKVSDVKDDAGRSWVWFQNPSLEESEAAARGNDWVVVVRPASEAAGKKLRLNFMYQGNVIADVGNSVLYVGARGSWYPNRSSSTRATYDLTFHYPDRLTLVATGDRAEENSSEGWKHSRWVSNGALLVAGFNLGIYDSRIRKAGKTTIEVYAAREAESALEKRNLDAHPPSELVVRKLSRRVLSLGVIPKQVPPLDPAALLDSVAENAADAVRYFESLFGTFPYSRLAISQIPGNFGQGWPGLVYLPTLSFLAKAERSALGVNSKSEELQDELFLGHEIAHQWWGNEVGWKTYHDQWLSEGFANYAAALYLARQKDGARKFRALLREYKRDLLSKTGESGTVESGGPIWLGPRLSNSLDPTGYNAIVYKKACWVLHMLHQLMTDPRTGSDEWYFKMFREFVVAYRDKEPSTEDFIRHVEKYMTRPMDLDHNGRLDWFFSDWVYGTGIPTYKLQSTTRRLAANKFMVEGSLEQDGVSEDFEMLVPVVAVYSKDRKVTLGQVPVSESSGRFRFTTTARPIRVAIDEENILAVVH